MRFPTRFIWGVVLVASSVANAGFVLSTTRTQITSGPFINDDRVTLSILNDGVGTTDPTFGKDIIYYDVTLSSSAATPKFFIHTWDGTIYNTATPSANNKADFGGQGFMQGDSNRDGRVSIIDYNTLTTNFGLNSGATWDQGDFNNDGRVSIVDYNVLTTNFGLSVDPASFVRFGTGGQFSKFFSLQTNPSETSQIYTDGQSVTGFEVTALVLDPSTVGLDDSVATPLAFAVVPHGQSVTFTGSASGHAGPAGTIQITDAGGALSPAAVPEPAILGAFAGAVLLLRRPRRI